MHHETGGCCDLEARDGGYAQHGALWDITAFATAFKIFTCTHSLWFYRYQMKWLIPFESTWYNTYLILTYCWAWNRIPHRIPWFNSNEELNNEIDEVQFETTMMLLR
ncbi:hypothetical protein CsSME_00022897 [Camellia sinensis var. sinensis]